MGNYYCCRKMVGVRWGTIPQDERKDLLKTLHLVLEDHKATSWCTVTSLDTFLGGSWAGNINASTSELTVRGNIGYGNEERV